MINKLLKRMIRIADVFLVARLKDERLHFPYKDDIRIFIPDTHLISNKRTAQFNYGTNNKQILTKLGQELIEYKNTEAKKASVTVYQLGDFLDLWRQTPRYWERGIATTRWESSVQRIIEDNASLINVLQDPALATQFVLGNHDIDIHRIPSFAGSKLKYYFPYNPEQRREPVAVALHGDLFSSFEKGVPDWMQYLAVYVFGPAKNPSEKDLGKVRNAMIKAHNKRSYANDLPKAEALGAEPIIAIESSNNEADTPTEFNVKRMGLSTDIELIHLEAAEEFFGRIEREMEWDMRMAFIGHTHYARIAVNDQPNHFFALVDCGAWITKCLVDIDGEETTMDSAQIGILWDNDVRIYQLCPKEA